MNTNTQPRLRYEFIAVEIWVDNEFKRTCISYGSAAYRMMQMMQETNAVNYDAWEFRPVFIGPLLEDK